jgi:hypothetical protein
MMFMLDEVKHLRERFFASFRMIKEKFEKTNR